MTRRLALSAVATVFAWPVVLLVAAQPQAAPSARVHVYAGPG